MKQYETYKDSGVEWIGEIPEHWAVRKLSYQFNFNTGFTPSTGKNEFYENGEHIWVNISDLKEKFISDSKTKITDLAIEGKEIVPKGSLLYSFKLSVGKMAFATKEIYTNEAIFSIFPNKNINLNYYYFLLDRILIHNANENIYGAKILNQELIKASKLVVPSPEEQTQIANYLNHKTAQLDTLIAKKEQLINLLQEERTAMINQAVTKGLDPNVPMKDSGIEWLGEIPAHWMKTGLNKIIKVKDGTHESPKAITKGDNTFPLITSKDFRNGKIIFKTAKHISSEDHYNIIKRSDSEKGDIIMSMIGGNIGNMVLIDTDKEFSIKNVCLFKTSGNEIIAKHLYYILKSSLLKIQIDLCSRGGAQVFLSLGDLRNLIYFVIPNSELKAIIKYLDEGTVKIDVIISKYQQEIELLKEYKSALISEVVTGKVDVREEVLN